MRSDAIQFALSRVTETGEEMIPESLLNEKVESVMGSRGRVEATFLRARSRRPSAVAGERGRLDLMSYLMSLEVRRGVDAR